MVNKYMLYCIGDIVARYEKYGVEEVRAFAHKRKRNGNIEYSYDFVISFYEDSKFYDNSGNKIESILYKYNSSVNCYLQDSMEVIDRVTQRERTVKF